MKKIEDDGFMERLQQADVQLCLHGHVHESRDDLFNYLHPTRKIHVVGAGSFGARADDRPEATPRLYNLIEVDPVAGTAKVKTRQRPRPGGAFQSYAVWTTEDPDIKQAFCTITRG